MKTQLARRRHILRFLLVHPLSPSCSRDETAATPAPEAKADAKPEKSPAEAGLRVEVEEHTRTLGPEHPDTLQGAENIRGATP